MAKYIGREREYQREWARNLRKNNPAEAKRRGKLAYARWKASHPLYVRQNKWIWDGLRQRYGLSQEEFSVLLKKQNGCCAICEEVFVPTKTHPRLSVDHDHKTKTIRGLLCHKCNVGLGLFRDSETYLQNALAYLKTAKQMELQLDR